MGLDMYLRASKWAFRDKELERSSIAGHGRKLHSIVVEAAYWRKANQIHSWFVNNVQDGKDDCGDYYVSKEQLIELRDICLSILEQCKLVPGKVTNGSTLTQGEWRENIEDGLVLDKPEIAEELLATQGGFFFGSTNYDQYYYEDIKYTVAQLNKILAWPDLKDWSFEYHSSW